MLTQHYEEYTPTDHQVWQLLYERQWKAVQDVAYKQFATSTKVLGFDPFKIPNFEFINARLQELTGWQIYAVPGLIANDHFFQLMFSKKFGATTWIRKLEELDYLEEPDMFHDVFGHIPLLADKYIAEYLHKLAAVAIIHIENEEVIEAIARLYWYTIEFGLVKENNSIRIYGAGILSSIGETKFCLSGSAVHVPFDLERILQTPYIKDKFQDQYFVLESMEQLKDIPGKLEKLLPSAVTQNV